MNLKLFQKNKRVGRGGFTLPELMVTVTIMLIITSISLFNYRQFNSVNALESLAYDMSLAIRQAQVYGVSVKESQTNTSPINSTTDAGIEKNFGHAYGIHFDASKPTQFILFVDTNDNDDAHKGHYDSGEELQIFTLQAGNTIQSFCAYQEGSLTNQFCSDGTSNSLTAMDILFKRPDPDALLTCISASNTCGDELVSVLKNVSPTFSAKIVVVSPSNVTRSIVVGPTGQISVNNP